MAELQHLDRAECLRLLASQRFGRLAVSVHGQPPMIRPVNYVFDDRTHSIVLRSGEGSKLQLLLGSRQAAFEIDGLDVPNRTGWSVVVRGVAEPITDPFELRRLERAPLDPWAPGHRPHWLRIRARTITGRRIVEPEQFESDSVVFRTSPAEPPG
ncbi:MAG: pyridoxamine 5'-phosphate oxidase family protein [Solirubrobacterales bacterium]|nr:pyridoxamine 5'-phosphate oxidase family protein [Solirubrobacterales bacterium]